MSSASMTSDCCQFNSPIMNTTIPTIRPTIQITHLSPELNPVSDLVVVSFYDKPHAVFGHMFRLAELNRLQENFPYVDQKRHRMLVAVSKATNDIVGFVDVDARPAAPNFHFKWYAPNDCVNFLLDR